MIERVVGVLALGAAVALAQVGPAAAQVPADAEFIGPPRTAADDARTAEIGRRAEAPSIDFATPVTGLEEAIRRAYWHNPRILAERARKRSTDFRLPQARALYGPRIDYQLDYGYRRDRIELLPDRFRTSSGWTGTVSAIVDQPLLTFGRLASNERRVQAVDTLISEAVSQGAKLETGGKRIGNKGSFYEPTVLSGVTSGMRIMNEEPFGPVALVAPFSGFDDVIAEANRLPYGLAAYAFTSSAKTATALGQELETGMLTLNHLGLALPEVPFGGIKDSGYGSEGGTEALEAYLVTKFVSQSGV